MPAAPAAGAAYLTHRAEQGASVVTVRMARAQRSAQRTTRAPPMIRCKHPGVVQVLKGPGRLRVGSAQSLAAAGAGLVELQEAGDW